MNDDIPVDDEIGLAVRRLRRGKAPGPSGLRADHFHAWYKEAHRRKDPDPTAWNTVVELVQEVYKTGSLPMGSMWSSLVL